MKNGNQNNNQTPDIVGLLILGLMLVAVVLALSTLADSKGMGQQSLSLINWLR
jgi:hypothetical protein